ncbi:hypothetical protein GE061_002497 [Apolygus lucorum]|uniref:Uncharacterized protein n=1 Tax=Apolygus lucorum TaxID=248454 RepID=A0A8S9X5A8_APOLU|nr:hypothetical protein GE061_002497 [Apolygus lucorum]
MYRLFRSITQLSLSLNGGRCHFSSSSQSPVLCRHFVTGKPSYLFYTTHPDWAPSLHLGYGNEKQESRKQQDLNRYLRAHARRNKKTASVQASSTPNVTAHVTEDQIEQQIENNELLSQDSMAPHNGSEQEPPGYYSFDFMIVDKEPDYMPVTNVNVQHPTSSDACYNEHEVNVMVETGIHDYGPLKNNNGQLSTSSGACYNEHEVNVKETKHAECQADLQNEELQKLRAALNSETAAAPPGGEACKEKNPEPVTRSALPSLLLPACKQRGPLSNLHPLTPFLIQLIDVNCISGESVMP